jgi:CDP-diacylglycerol---glycerol-3-phosphate 3-phosphatidyltransferase
LSSASAGTRGDGDSGPDGPGSPEVGDWLEAEAAAATESVLGVRPGSDPAADQLAPDHRAAPRQRPALDEAAQPGQQDQQDQPPAYQPPAPRLLNVANALTVLRLVLVPFFVWSLLSGGTSGRSIAFVAFALASVTDLLDGELARRWSLITDFGKIADPIADKALTGSALITLSYLGELPWWVTGVIVFRELAITGLRFWVIRRGVIAASRGGKAKTMLQVIAISLYVLPVHLGPVRAIVMGAALVVTLVSGIDYTVRAIRLHRAVQ